MLKKLTKNNELSKILQPDIVFLKQLAIIAVPIIIQNLIGAMLNMVDNVMVGGLGQEALAAVGIANQIFFVFIIVLFGISSGISVFSAQFWGKGDIGEIKKAIGMGLTFSLAFGALFSLLIFIFPKEAISIFTNDIEVIELGAKYIRIVSFGYPLTAVSMVYSIGLRSTENTKIPLISAVISLGLNTFLNYSLIYGNFGFPKLEVTGAAYATVASRLVEFLIIGFIVYYYKYPVACKISDIKKINKKFILSITKISLPVMLNESLWVVGTSIFALVYGRMGTGQIAAFNIVQTIDRIAFVAALGLGNACAVLVGKQIGAKRENLAFVYGARSIILAPALGIFVAVIMLLTRTQILGLYSISEEVYHYTSILIVISAFSMPIRSTNFTTMLGVLRAGGDARTVLLLDTIPLWLIAVPMTVIAGLVIGLPIYFVYALALSEEILKCSFGIYRFLSRKWIRNLVETKEQKIIEQYVEQPVST